MRRDPEHAWAEDSGGIEADLTASGLKGIEGVVRDAEIAQGIQEASSDVLEAAEEFDGGCLIASSEMLEEASHLEKLQEDVGYLQQVVESFDIVRVEAVCMLQVQAAVFLGVEPLVLNLGSDSPSFLGDSRHVVVGDMGIGDPTESGCLCL